MGEQLIILSDQYKSLKNQPAFQHFQGMIWGIKEKIESGILRGVMDDNTDVTPQYRAIYGILLQILAIPGQIENKTLAAEYQAYLTDIEQDTGI